MLRDAELQELLDRARIADTVYAFCDFCTDGDVTGVVELFTEDGEMDVGGGAIHVGTEELTDMFTDRFRLYASSTFLCSGVRMVRYQGPTAATTTHLYGVHDAARGHQQMHLWGRYEDELVRQGDRWLFRRRVLRVSGMNLQDLQVLPGRFAPAGPIARRFEAAPASLTDPGVASIRAAEPLPRRQRS